MARLGQLLRSKDPSSSFELGPNPFRDGPYANRVRHVTIMPRESYIDVFFSAIGDAPEKILHTRIPLTGDWTQWETTDTPRRFRGESAWPVECAAAAIPAAPAR